MINKQHPIIHGHSLLSILKLAAVQDNIPTPEPSSASHSTQAALSSTLFPILFLLVLNLVLVHATLSNLDGGPYLNTIVSSYQSTSLHFTPVVVKTVPRHRSTSLVVAPVGGFISPKSSSSSPTL